MVWLRARVVVILSAWSVGVVAVFTHPVCALLYGCGCRLPWAGGVTNCELMPADVLAQHACLACFARQAPSGSVFAFAKCFRIALEVLSGRCARSAGVSGSVLGLFGDVLGHFGAPGGPQSGSLRISLGFLWALWGSLWGKLGS